MTTTQTFQDAFEVYLDECMYIHEQHMVKNFPNNSREGWRFTEGPKYVRVVHGSSAHSFVEIATGNVLKPAGWGTPAKHTRGNIYDAAHGCGTMGPYGPASLR